MVFGITLSIILIFFYLMITNIKIDGEIKRMKPSEISAKFQNKDLVFIDVREPFEFSKQHIKGSENIPLSALYKEYKNLPSDKNIILVCRSGNRSLKALSFLKDQGYDNVINLDGGILAWQKSGYCL